MTQHESNRFAGKEHVLNHTAQRFHLTRPKSVGAVMELIRKCQPDSIDEWERFYWENAYTKSKEPVKITTDIINELGIRLFEKIRGVVIPEWTQAFETITSEDCIEYIKDVTIRRTFNGFMREKSVVYDNLAKIFTGIQFEPAGGDLDESGDVDFICRVSDNLAFGLQIKPITSGMAFQGYDVSDRMKKNFVSFERAFGGPVFIVYSESEKIINDDVIHKIREFIENATTI